MTDIAQDDANDIFDDTIFEAVNIGKFVFRNKINMARNDDERERMIKQAQRSVYHLVETSRLPVFRMGSRLAARKSALKKFIEEQERKTSSKTKGFKDPEDGDE